jgi:hypothetical protein
VREPFVPLVETRAPSPLYPKLSETDPGYEIPVTFPS